MDVQNFTGEKVKQLGKKKTAISYLVILVLIYYIDITNIYLIAIICSVVTHGVCRSIWP